MNKEKFDDYIARFNARDDSAFDDYLHPDLHVQNGTLEYWGVQAMKDHYAGIWDTFTEELFPSDFIASETNAAIRMKTRFVAQRDNAASLFGPVAKGDRFEFLGVISYRIAPDGRFSDILVAAASFRAVRADGTAAELGTPH
ncbi:nuclear transport factor 2 family protein [Microbacterium album]|uniref:SnoaL-like domain-containing protein n=1 Tax=Microbacterium album TaxID=2053191 RepID=A0A917IAS7_9MICO|nr:nuclear transport factor 2 family protein [Microbacterium album]GGH33611.1 hypothetical protein GCM10010921_00680 [Microbacterium album]